MYMYLFCRLHVCRQGVSMQKGVIHTYTLTHISYKGQSLPRKKYQRHHLRTLFGLVPMLFPQVKSRVPFIHISGIFARRETKKGVMPAISNLMLSTCLVPLLTPVANFTRNTPLCLAYQQEQLSDDRAQR